MAICVIYDKATCLEVGRFGSHPEVKIPITGVVDPKVERYRLVPYKLAFHHGESALRSCVPSIIRGRPLASSSGLSHSVGIGASGAASLVCVSFVRCKLSGSPS
jgi:hypothetical protein